MLNSAFVVQLTLDIGLFINIHCLPTVHCIQIHLEMNAFFVEMSNFVSKGVGISMLSNLEKLPLLVITVKVSDLVNA